MYGETIYSPLEKIGRILSDQFDIQVIHSGDKCYTDGRTIVLPAVPEGAPPEFYAALEGRLDHEAAHIMATDWEIVKRSYDHPMLKSWTNLCEDARIERFITRMWPGCRLNLEATQRFLLDQDLAEWEEIDKENQYFKVAILYAKGYGDWIKEIPDHEEILKFWEDILPALDRAATQPDSLHSLALAVWIMDTLHPGWRKKGKEELKSLAPTKEELKKLMKAILEMEGEETEEEEEEEGGEYESEGEILRTKMEEYDEEKHGEEEDGPASRRKRTMLKKAGKSLAEALEVGGKLSSLASSYHHTYGKKGAEHYMPFTTEGDKIIIAEDGTMPWFQEMRRQVQKVSSVMTRKLRMVLTVRGYARTEYEKSWGRLDVRRLPRFLVSGNPRCFKQKKKGEKLECRVSLLIDQSGSMRYGKMPEARKAAVLFGEFCEALGIPFEILGFTTSEFGTVGPERWNAATDAEKERYTRWDDLILYVYKQYHESWKRVGHRLESMSAHCHNLDAESVQVAAQRLIHASKPNERKVLFVFSDGMPEQSIGRHQEAQKAHLRKVMQKLDKSHVEAIGIGILTDAPKHYYPNWVSISDPTKLAGTQLEKLSELFQAKKRKAASRRA